MFEKEQQSIMKFGFVDPVTVRETEAGLEIIDGEQRWRAATSLGYEEIDIWNVGQLPDAVAKQLTIVLNETRGQHQPEKVGDILRDLLNTSTMADLLTVLPYTEAEFSSLAGLDAFTWNKPEPKLSEPAWVERVFRLPPDVSKVLDDAFTKVREEEPGLADWQCLEYLAAEVLA